MKHQFSKAIMTRNFAITLLFLGFIHLVSAQSAETLKHQLEFCKKESAKNESTIETYKTLLEIQGKQISDLKITVQAQEIEINNLKSENEKLQTVALDLLELGNTYEEMGKFQEAISIYKLLIKSYPSSMEAIASKLKVIELKKKEVQKAK